MRQNITIIKTLITILLLIQVATALAQEQSVDDNTGNWLDNSTWIDGTTPGYTNVPSFIIYGDVTSDASLTMVNAASQSIDVYDTLTVRGNLSFATNRNFASVTVRTGGILVIFGNLSMGKNNAGVTVEAGGVLVITGNVTDSGGGGNSINAAGDIYVGGTSSDVGGGGTVKPIENLSDDGFSEVEDYVNGNGNTPLPVDLLFFKAESEQDVQLQWATATEINNDYFSLERSEDGINFYEIGRIEGNGDSNQEIQYEYIDRFTLAPVEYYRLKQVDVDGQFEYFEIIRVATKVASFKTKMTVYPTIVKNGELLLSTNKAVKLSNVELISLSGVIAHVLDQEVNQTGHINYSIDVSSFSKGLYLLKVRTSEGDKITSRVVIE